jgi:hypothetical protein
MEKSKVSGKEIQKRIHLKVNAILSLDSVDLITALALKSQRVKEQVTFFRKVGDKNRVNYEMRQFLKWLEMVESENNI